MSCPDWSRLAGERRTADAAASAEPAAWRQALKHLDGCGECRDEALEADPVLLFRRLPTFAPDAAAIEDMRSGVAALRRAQRLVGGVERAGEPEAVRRPSRWWGRAAAAAILAAGLLGFRPDAEHASRVPPDAWSTGSPVPVARLEAPAAFAVDEIDRPTASVYHFDDDEVGVVMVVDAGLDV